MFIIVETIEDDEVNLCVVPASWEKNGILFWPPGRKGATFRKNYNILPDINSWSKQKCTVRKKNFKTFQEAIEAEKFLSQFDDTEDEVNYLTQNSSKQNQSSQKTDNIDYNHLIAKNNIIENNTDEIEEIDKNCPVDIVPTHDLIPSSSQQTCSEPIIMLEDGRILDLNFQKLLCSVQNRKSFDPINSDLQNVTTKIFREISEINVKLDKLIDLFKNSSMIKRNLIEKPHSSMHQNDALKNEMFEKDIREMKPLAIESDINNLEKNLRNDKFELAFIKVMSEIGGTSGKKYGNIIAYLLIDQIFERQLLTLCSWTGFTKNKKEKTKIAFSKYNRIIKAIYKIIHLADSDYTTDNNITFLKQILRNSGSRNKRLQKRQSKQNEISEKASNNFESEDNLENIEEETSRNTDGITNNTDGENILME